MEKEVSAIIVARKGSVRIPSKSMLKLGDETLISKKIKQLKACNNIDRVIFGSDCDKMIEHAKTFGAEVVKRPDYFCDETQASANEMIANMMDLVQSDIIVWAHCTNPFLSSQTYDKAIETFFENQDKYDSLLSVVEFKEHLWGQDKKPLNYNPYQEKHVPAKELPPYYMQDGGIFIQPYLQMKKNKYFFGNSPMLFVIPESEFLDINNNRDYLLAKIMLEEGK